MAFKKVGNINIEDAHIIFRNFSGKENRFNRAGNRKFGVIIDDPEQAKLLHEDGWNVRALPPREGEEGDTKHFLEVAISFENVPPKVVLISGKKKSFLDEESINALDFAEILHVDLTIRPYNWTVNGKEGIKAYVKTMYVTIDKDEFADKYEDLEG